MRRGPLRVALAVCAASAAASLAPPGVAGQAVIVGRVLDAASRVAVAGAEVRIEGTELSVVTDSAGRYVVTRAPAGPQVLRAERIGYAPARLALVVPPRGTLERDILISETALRLEGVTVTADAAGRARGELGTASVMAEEAIRQQTAVSLAGVLDLVPGMQMKSPGLESVSQVGLRAVPTAGAASATGATATAELASFGTLIVLDGVPVSNNGNLQTLGPRGELSFTTSAGGGVDLRRIPAASIERVEVIRGVPSARYGDLTQGAIVVDTRTAAIAPELLARYDSRTLEASVVTGHELRGGAHAVSFSSDVARTRSQPGISDDETSRFAAQLAHRWTAGASDRLTMDTRVQAFQLVDDRPEDPNIRPERWSSSEDRGIRLSERARVVLSPRSRVTWTASYSRLEQRSSAGSPRVRGPQPFTDRLTPGRSEGRFVIGRYQSEVEVEGIPQLLYSRLELGLERDWLGFAHELRAGSELRREWNSGDGYQFDMEFPPQVTFNSVSGYDRPRSFRSVPPLAISAYYLDDRLTRSFGSEGLLSLQGGLRVEALHQGEWWASGFRDAVVQPRLNLEVAPRPWLRVRGGWGRTAKAPSLDRLHPAPQYHDVVNVNYFANDPAERLAVLTTEIKDPTNPDLGLVTATKREVAVELAIQGATLQIVGFADRIDDAIGLRQDPEFVLRDRYALTDSVLGNGVPPEIIEPPYRTDTIPVLVPRSDHILALDNRGVEVTAMLPELRPLRLRLQAQGAWVRSRQTSTGLYFGTRQDVENFQLFEQVKRIPYWEGGMEEGERILATYRLIHHQPELGFVVTGVVQHNIRDRSSDPTSTDTLAFAGYLDRRGELVPVPASERAAPAYADLRVPRSGVLTQLRSTPGDWMLGLQVSKTLPLEGRLSFWAFNLLDNRGIFQDPSVQRRVYPPMRFGLEVTMPMTGWWRRP